MEATRHQSSRPDWSRDVQRFRSPRQQYNDTIKPTGRTASGRGEPDFVTSACSFVARKVIPVGLVAGLPRPAIANEFNDPFDPLCLLGNVRSALG
jgi:hypothetical protein